MGKKKSRFFRPRCIEKGMSKTLTFPTWAAKSIGVLVSWAREGRAKSRFKENTGLGERFFIDQGKPWEYLNTSSKELVKKINVIIKILLLKKKPFLSFRDRSVFLYHIYNLSFSYLPSPSLILSYRSAEKVNHILTS